MLNKSMIQGRLCADPELKKTKSGESVTSFTVAVDRDYRNGDQKVDFLPVVCWGKTAEFVSKYFAKGSMILVCGRVQTRQYQDKNGNSRTATEVIAESVYFGGSKKESAAATVTVAETATESDAPDVFVEIGEPEDLPFL